MKKMLPIGKNLLSPKFSAFLICIVVSAFLFGKAEAQFYSQTFSNDMADVVNGNVSDANYVAASPSSTQLTFLGGSGGSTIGVSGGTLNIATTSTSTVWAAVRNTNFSGPPTSLRIVFDANITAGSSGSSDKWFFYVGSSSANSTAAQADANTHSKFSVRYGSSGAYTVRNPSGGVSSSFSGSTLRTFTIAINNSGSSISYTAPDGSTESVADDTYDLWVGTTKVFNDIAATTASQNLNNIKFGDNVTSSSGRGNWVIDNFSITSLAATGPTLSPSPTSLTFPTTASGAMSASQSFTLGGSNLTGAPGNITVTAPSTDFQVSNDDVSYGPTTTIAYSSATLNSNNTVYVKFTPQSAGAKSGNITFSGGGVSSPPTFAVSGTAYGTYTWNQTGTAAWTTAANWTPSRDNPTNFDILQFNGGGSVTATSVPAATIGQLVVSNNSTVNLQAGGSNTLSIGGNTGTDLSVAAGSQLNVNGANALTLNVATGATGSISGSMDFSNAASVLTATDASGITFESGSTFTQNNTGNVFGSGTSNSIVFANGATFSQLTGSNPFQKTQPASVVVFQTGSLFQFQIPSGTPSFSGRTYGNFEYVGSGSAANPTGSAAVSIDNLTVTSGTFTWGMTGTPGHAIKGNISVASGAILNFSPGSAGTVNLNGTSAQTIGGSGTVSVTTSNQTFVLNNANGLSLQTNLATPGTITLTNGKISLGNNNLTLSGTTGAISGAPAFGSSGNNYIVTDGTGSLIIQSVGTGARTGNILFPVGASASVYNPVRINNTGTSDHFSVKVKSTFDNILADANKVVNRQWTISEAVDGGSNAALGFQWNAIGEAAGFNRAGSVVIGHYNTDWTEISATVSGSDPYTATASGFTSFSPFGVGNANAFMVAAVLPTVTTTAASAITATSASSGGDVTSDGGGTITERGVVYSTSANPTTADTKVIDGAPGTGSFVSSLTGLTPATTYHVRAYAINSAGTAYGADESFMTSAAAPTVTTTSISSITSVSAESGGNVTADNGDAVTERGVVYSTSSNPTTADTKVIDGSGGTGSFTSSLTGLTPGTTYHVRAYAINSVGTSYGADLSFTTLDIPTVTTTDITLITNSSASTGGEVTADGGAAVTERGVVYSTSSSPTTSDTKVIDGSGGLGTFTSSLSGLSAATQYYVRAYAINSVGTAYGNEESFTTSSSAVVPTVTTTSVTSITSTTASTGGEVLSDGGAAVTERGVVYSTSVDPTTADTKVIDGSGGTGSYASNLSGLTPGVTYHVRAYAINSAGTSYGDDEMFTTLTTPTVTTTAVTSITSTTASSGGNVTSDGGATVTERGVVYSTNANPTTSDTKVIDGSGGTGAFASSLTSLSPGTTYHVRAYAINSVGTSYGADESFATLVSVPAITTTVANTITESSAESGGTSISANGGTISAKGVVWDISANPTVALSTKTDEGAGTGDFTSSLTALTAQTLYNYRAYATNEGGTGYGSNLTFRTLSNPPTAQATGLNAVPVSPSQIDLDWTGATFPGSGATTKGYVLLRATSPNTPSLANGNGAAPAAGANTTIVSSTIADNSTSTSSTGLSPNTTYNYLLVPFSWDGTNASTYHYLTASTPTANATTTDATLSDDYFQSNVTTGNWNAAGSWQSSHDNSNWITATAPPTSAAKIIAIRNTNTITVSANVTVDEVVIDAGGQVDIATGVTLTVANGSGDDLSVSGTLKLIGTGAISYQASANGAVENGGTYIHASSASGGGTIPTFTWKTGSTCEFAGTGAGGTLNGVGQAFYNFKVNAPGITGAHQCSGALTTVNGNFDFLASGNEFRLSTSQTFTTTINGDLNLSGGTFVLSSSSSGSPTLTIGGSVTASAGTWSMGVSGTTTVLNVGGDFTISGTAITPGTSSSASCTINVNGIASGTTGSFNISSGSFTPSSTAVYTFNIAGDMNMSGGTLSLNASGSNNSLANIFVNGTVAGTTGRFNMTGGSVTESSTSGWTMSTLGDFILSNNASFVGNNGNSSGRNYSLTIGGNFSIGAGTTFTISNTSSTATNLNFSGGSSSVAFTNNGTLNISGVNTISVASGKTVSLNSDLTIPSNKALSLAGFISTGSNKVIMSANTILSNTTGWVIGNLQKNFSTGSNVSRTFEIGGANNYRPVAITIASVTTAGDLTAFITQADGEHPNVTTSGLDQTKDVNRYWQITNSGVVFNNATVTFNWIAGDLDGGANTANFKVAKYNGAWSQPTVANPTATSIQATGVTSFSEFIVGEQYPLVVTTQPVDASTCSGGNVSFDAASTSTPTPTIQWQEKVPAGSFTNITDGGVYSGATTGTLSITGTPVSMNGNQYRAVFTNVNGSVNSDAKTLTVEGYTWLGSVSSNMNATSNWSSCGKPLNGDDFTIATIGGGTNPALDSDWVAGSITLNPGTSLEISNNTLTVNGTISGSGVLIGSSASNLVINGSGAGGTLYFDQSTDGSTNALNNFTLNRTGGTVTLGTKLVLLNIYTPTAGTLASGGFLHLRSTASNTARIAQGAPGGGYITGNVVAERYISGIGIYGDPSAYNRAYRMLTPMVTTAGTINANWQEGQTNPDVNTIVNTNPGYGTQITGAGGAANGFDPTLSNQSSLYTFNAVTPAWVAATNTNVATLNAKTGYLLYIRGNRSMDMTSTASPLPATNTTLRATGTLLTGTQTFASLQGSGKYNLVTNPFASPVDWTSIYGANSADFENYYTFWDPNQGSRGAFVTVTSGGIISAGDATTSIQSGQAFFVKALPGAGSPTLTVSETHKTTTNNIDVFRNGSTEQFRTSLYFNDGFVRRLADGVVNVYDNIYSTEVDGRDALQMANWDEDIAIIRNSNSLSIETRPLIDVADTIFLSVARLKQQPYQWQFDPSNFNAPGLQAYLQDKFLNNETPVSLSAQTLVNFTVTTDAASAAADRFRIVFRSSAPLPVKITKVKATDKQTAIQVEWNTLGEFEMDKYLVEKSTDGREFVAVGTVLSKNMATATTYTWLDANRVTGSNYYRIRSISKNGQATVSEVVRVNVGKGKEGITVYPNPIVGDVVAVQLNNVASGKYSIVITNKLGQQVSVTSFDHAGGSASQTISLPKAVSAGIYQLQVIGNGVKYELQIIKN